MDPQLIILKVESMLDQLEHSFRKFDASIQSAEYLGRHTVEIASRIHTGAIINRGEAEVAVGRAARIESSMFVLSDRIKSVQVRCDEACSKLEWHVQRTDISRNKWEGELTAALGWLNRAQIREDAAIAERDRAMAELHSALDELSRAESALAWARNQREYAGRDKNGNAIYRPMDTTPYQQAVYTAGIRVGNARTWVAEANAELQAAIQNRRAAEARVASCQHALQLLQKASDELAEGANHGRAFLAALGRAQEEVQRAARLTLDCKTHAAESLQCAVAACDSATSSCRIGDESLALHHMASGEKTLGQHKAIQGSHEIGWRMEQLRAFDTNSY